MKLVKNERQNSESGQCQAITGSGSQCSRKATQQGYCTQHYKKLEEQGLIVNVKGDEELKEIPEVPEGLAAVGRRHWQVYCQYLIDRGRLYQVYLLGIANLCYLEEQLEDTKKKIGQYGNVNIYDNGIQRNGFASHFDKLLGHIRSLRADYGLTVASDKSVGEGSGSEGEAPKKKGYNAGKSKGW